MAVKSSPEGSITIPKWATWGLALFMPLGTLWAAHQTVNTVQIPQIRADIKTINETSSARGEILHGHLSDPKIHRGAYNVMEERFNSVDRRLESIERKLDEIGRK